MDLINDDANGHTSVTVVKNTTGKLIVTQPPYFYAPEIKYVNGLQKILPGMCIKYIFIQSSKL